VVILYTVESLDGSGDMSLEFCGVLTAASERDGEVLFGVAEGTDWWDGRWERGRYGCEFLYAEYRAAE
jgi:hypothetical protein